ncbi:MAG: type I glutamate--ammonia ligase [Thermoproteota archaeon]|nr:MAG: type I glutamate--ammonia ligase [Candidatus Korarchaeota archaeon]
MWRGFGALLDEHMLEAKKLVDEHRVKWILASLVDIRGRLYSLSVPAEDLESYATDGIGFDGSSVRGLVTIDKSDMVLKLDLSTLRVLPWTLNSTPAAIALGSVYRPGSTEPFEGCPRSCAMALERKLGEQELKAIVGPEVEFFLFSGVDFTKLSWDPWATWPGAEDSKGAPRVLPTSPELGNNLGITVAPKDGYFRAPPEDMTLELRNEISRALEEWFKCKVTKHHHEVATGGQIEIGIEGTTLLKACDSTVYYKFAAKNIARAHGMVATFMPKPLYMDNASGMHIHLSLWRGSENLMYSDEDSYAELSQTARYFIGGLLDHARALTAVCAPTVNSYKRLVPGFEAPVYVAWSRANRSALVRVPVYYWGREHAKEKRVEYRGVDPSANPYLAFTCLVAAGLDGIQKKIDPGDPVDKDLYKMTPEERRSLGIRELPGSLKEALEELESDEVLQRALGKHVYEAFTEYKRKEWLEYSLYITPWEYARYWDC